MRRRDLIAAAIGALVATTLAGGVAWATSNPGSVINACYSKYTGDLRVIDGRNSCRSWLEKPISWGQAGQKGDPGAKGDPGPPGPPGAKGDSGVTSYALVSGDATVPSGGAQVDAVLDCPSGTKVVGGGWGGGRAGVVVNASAPSANGASWIGSIQNNSSTDLNATFYAICIGVGGTAPAPASVGVTTSRAGFTVLNAPAAH